MANTFTKIYIQFVFSVKTRKNQLHNSFKEELHKYITGIVKNCGCKLLCINSVPDHIHIFVAMGTRISIGDLMKEVKSSSSKFINDNRLTKIKFAWQDGYGAFSYSESQVNNVIEYINSQEKHHKKKTFKEEYLEFLEKFQIVYDHRYVFDLD